MFRFQTPTFNWPKQEFCTLYIFYYKETENIYPYYVSSNPVVLSAFWYISPLFCCASTTPFHPSFFYARFYFSFIRMCTLTRLVHSFSLLPLNPGTSHKKIGMKRTKKEGKEKKLSDSFFVFEQGLSSLLVHMVPPFRCYGGRKKSSVSFFPLPPSWCFPSPGGVREVRRQLGNVESMSFFRWIFSFNPPTHTLASPPSCTHSGTPIPIYLVLKRPTASAFAIANKGKSIEGGSLFLTHDIFFDGCGAFFIRSRQNLNWKWNSCGVLF